MNAASTIIAVLAGLTVFIGGIAVTLRAIFKQINATDDNTNAVKELTGQLHVLQHAVNEHETRITVAENRLDQLERTGWGRGRNPRP